MKMKIWFLQYKLKKAMARDDGEKVVKITDQIRNIIDKDVKRLTRKFNGLFFGILLAEATLWVKAMKQIADETDKNICEHLLSHSTIVTAKKPVFSSGDCMRDPL